MSIHFIKMHGLGNDFVILDGRVGDVGLDAQACRRLADRRRGVGCDQVIVMERPSSAKADLFMRIYNADGSEVKACGNAARCVARLFFDETGRTNGVIETRAGLLAISAEGDGTVAVDFGPPRLGWQEIPLTQALDTLSLPLRAGDLSNPCCISMGNPHAVFFVPDVGAVPLEVVGPQLETHALFPERANIEIAQILDRTHIRMRVWERGAGITQACGSGACATLVAAVRRGLCERKATIALDGGDLTITWREDGHVVMVGGTGLAFRGELADDFLGESRRSNGMVTTF